MLNTLFRKKCRLICSVDVILSAVKKRNLRFLPHIYPFPVISSLVSNFVAKFIDRLRHFAAYNIMHFSIL
jgi:hypothetical protein